MIRPEFVTRQVNEIIRDVSAIGSFTVLLVIDLVFFCFDLQLGITMLASLAVVELLGAAFKIGLHRARPDGQEFTNLLEKADAGSFPSVHTARTAAAVVLVHARFPGLFWLLPVTIGLIVLVAVSRVLLQRHYLSDVVGGLILGGLTGAGLAVLLLR